MKTHDPDAITTIPTARYDEQAQERALLVTERNDLAAKLEVAYAELSTMYDSAYALKFKRGRTNDRIRAYRRRHAAQSWQASTRLHRVGSGTQAARPARQSISRAQCERHGSN